MNSMWKIKSIIGSAERAGQTIVSVYCHPTFKMYALSAKCMFQPNVCSILRKKIVSSEKWFSEYVYNIVKILENSQGQFLKKSPKSAKNKFSSEN